MAEPKTQKNDASVADFIDAVEPGAKREDARSLLKLLEEITGERPSMWGDSLIGFGSYDTGSSGTWFKIGFSPRKRDTTVYLMDGTDKYADELARLGKHRVGKSCLYLGRLEQIDVDLLGEILTASWEAPSVGE